MVKLPTLFHKVVQTSLQYHSEVHVRSAVDECEIIGATSFLVEEVVYLHPERGVGFVTNYARGVRGGSAQRASHLRVSNG